MIDNVNMPSSGVFVTKLHVVKRPGRLRENIDRKRAYLLVKRSLDIFISLFVILCVLSWLTPLLGILIRIDSAGPLFFIQRRIGRGGRSFFCYKFRTMVVNDEKDEKPARENDERITRLGKILRQSNLDEFPQFLNVFLGTMSIVGPRPHMYADCTRFSLSLPGYKFRNMVKPGLTGLAQVKGYHGPALTRESIAERYRWDEYYIKNLSFWLDTKILFVTALKRVAALFAYPFKQNIKEQVYEM